MSKFCKTCGAELASEASVFCTKCGANQNGVTQSSINDNQNQSGYEYSQNVNPNPTYAMPMNNPTSVLEWVGWILLGSFLPIIGQIIMLCTAKDETVKNYAKAMLIFAVIGIVLSIIMTILMVVAGITMSEMYY